MPMNETDVMINDGVAGHGVFADQSFEAGDLILPIQGTLVSSPTRHTIQIDMDKHLALSLDDPAIKLNHHCNANACLLPHQKALIARYAIPEGDEIFFNYLTSEFELAHPFDCQCDAAICPGKIRGCRYLSPMQQQALYPMLLPYLQEYVDSL